MPSAPNAQCQEKCLMISVRIGTATMTPIAEPCARIAVGRPRRESGNHL